MMPSSDSDSGSHASLNTWLTIAVSLQVLLVGLGCAVGAANSMYTYKSADASSMKALCADGVGADNARWLDSSCGTKIMEFTGQSACEAGNGFGCGMAATLAGSDEGISEALEGGPVNNRASSRSQKLASRGCDLDNQLSCLLEFGMLARSQNRYEIQEALRLGDRKCGEDMPIMCHEMGRAFESAARTSRDRNKAVEYYRTACEGEFAPGCRKLGKMYDDGFGVASNQTRADKYYGKACELGDTKACDKVGEQPPEDTDGDRKEMFLESMNISYKDMFQMAKMGCQNGFSPACTYFGRVIERGELRGRYVGLDQAVELYEMGCERDASRSCFRLGAYYARTDRSIEGTDKALKYAKKACAGDVDGACDLRRDMQARSATEASTFEQYANVCDEGRGDGKSKEEGGEKAGSSSEGGTGAARKEESGGNAKQQEEAKLERFEMCQIAAIGYANGQVVEKDLQRAVSLYRQGCDLGHATACWRAGKLLDQNKQVSASAEDINTLYEQGCEGGAMGACDQLGRRLAGDFALGSAMDEGGGDGSEMSSQNLDRAKSYLETACNARYGKACARLATILENQAAAQDALDSIPGVKAEIASKGEDGSDIDLEARRESLLQRGCSAGHVPACRRLGVFYLDRAQTAEDYKQAFGMLYIGCRQDDAEACAYLGINEVDFEDPELRDEGQKHLETACIGGSGLGCRGLGDGYYNGSFVEKNRKKSADLYRQACNYGSGPGCAMLARQYEAGEGVDYSPDKARKKYEKACEKGHGEGCLGLAKMYLYGSATDYSLEKGEKYLQEGCNMGHNDSCYQLEQLHTSGVHKEISFTAARQALETGCIASSLTACDRVANYYYLGFGADKDKKAGDERANKVGDMLKTRCKTYGVAATCVRWAHHMAHGLGTETDASRARNYLEGRCEENEGGQSCLEIADLKARGHIYEHNRVAAMEQLRSWCEDDNLGACNLQAYYRMHGRDPDLAPEEAVSHYRSECDGDDSTACAMLARAYLTGFGARREPRRAVRLLEPMCRPGNETGCIAYTTGLIGMGSSDRAAERLKASEAGCDNRHSPHCVVAGKLFANGLGTSRSLKKAKERFTKACKEGLVFACPSADLVEMYLAARKAEETSDAAKKCEGGDLKACLVAGVDAQYGITGERSPETAAGFYDTACQKDELLGCAARVSMHRFREVNLAGDAYFDVAKKSCEARSPDFCYALAHRTAPFEWKPAVDLASRACERGEKRACIWLVDRGVSPPVPRDGEK